jgi:hypothetical protein
MASLSTDLPVIRWARNLLLLPLLFSVAPAQAELELTGWYAGFMYSDSSEELDLDTGGTRSVNKGHLKIKAGKTLNEYLSVEGQFGMTTNTGDKRGRFTYGVYLRPSKDFGRYRLYGLVGASGFYDYHDVEEDVSESGASIGFGIEMFGSKDVALSFEYLRMIDKSIDEGDYVYDSIGLGFSYYFTDDTSYFSRNRNKIKSIRY